MDEFDVVVVGAGVVGLAVARALALAGREVVVLEAADAIGTGASSRNSEVVHAGLYYPTGSAKARLCVAGRRQLYAYCAARGVPHRVCGKLVVATEPGQLHALRALVELARANGVEGLDWCTAEQVRPLEPEVRCVAALHSATTGIVDSHGLMRALREDAEAHGASVLLQSPVLGGRGCRGGLEVDVGGAEPVQLRARHLVNCAGLGAPGLAAAIEGPAQHLAPRGHRNKGCYFALAGPSPFRRLVYPLHDGAWLGVHVVLDLAGQVRFGPDAEWLPPDAPDDYDVDPARAPAFAAAVRRYWPGLPDGALVPAFAGIRAKITGPGEPAADFAILGPAQHGQPGLVHLLGIESPGLTAALAIGDEVVRLAGA
ncbi:MAG: NAD(P)/FAD-dependent oxidoreductase [Planctomycetes bacterium]|nr:NAD(P)/FAD-dependent oxidoreductase [Planctomycetota bacterium]